MSIMTRPETTEARTVVEAPQLAPGGTVKPKLLSVEDAKSLDVARMTDLFKAHINPGQLHFMKLLGFHKIKVERAEGMFYIDQNGRKILDFFGGFGSLAFGHNHPRILEARRRFQEPLGPRDGIGHLSAVASTDPCRQVNQDVHVVEGRR